MKSTSVICSQCTAVEFLPSCDVTRLFRHRLELMRHIYNDDFEGSSAAADDLFCPSPSGTGSPSAAQPALLPSSSKLVLASLPPRYPLEFLPANMCVTRRA